ncbi:hypothetical protein [Bacteroides acidifaciens]|uniref:hypothetical protein n=1 Tax=Bacteroides acidifaciens TaxID=85831 RepID=UPI00158B1EF1|nr:hypothetical protein [Bacteroides acidifaciens]
MHEIVSAMLELNVFHVLKLKVSCRETNRFTPRNKVFQVVKRSVSTYETNFETGGYDFSSF